MVIDFLWFFFLRPCLFLFEPEVAHNITFKLLKAIHKLPFGEKILKFLFQLNTGENITAFGLEFKNRIGLAAGLDKNGDYIEELSTLGFSHIEIGTITPEPQGGNDKPRLFRLKKDKSLINRMGFNNKGSDHVAQTLSKLKKPIDLVLGINIGKNKWTDNVDAWKDYVKCFEKLHFYGDYFTINISSPNTPNLRYLQDKKPLSELLQKIQEKNLALEKPKPLLIKIAPDLSEEQLDDIIEISENNGVKGIIMGNTTISRSGLTVKEEKVIRIGPGGLSGKPIFKVSTDKLKYLHNKLGTKLTLIGVGGIMNKSDVQEKIENGASLIQLYTGFVYNGPGFVRKILRT